MSGFYLSPTGPQAEIVGESQSPRKKVLHKPHASVPPSHSILKSEKKNQVESEQNNQRKTNSSRMTSRKKKFQERNFLQTREERGGRV